MESVKYYLKNAYVNLLTKIDYKKINIKILTEEAKVSRVSYYRNFSSLEELVSEVFEDYLNKIYFYLAPLVNKNNKEEIENDLVIFLNRCKEFKSKQKRRILSINLSYLTSVLERKFKQKNINPPKLMENEHIDFLKITIIFQILKSWDENNYKENINDLAKYISSLIFNLNSCKIERSK